MEIEYEIDFDLPESRDILTGKITSLDIDSGMAYCLSEQLVESLHQRAKDLNVPHTSDEAMDIWYMESDTMIKFMLTLSVELCIHTINLAMMKFKLPFNTSHMTEFSKLKQSHWQLMSAFQSLRETMPDEFMDSKHKANQYSDVCVSKIHSFKSNPWKGKHKNVTHWVELDNGMAVGWNEGSRGNTFPIIKIKT